MKFIDKLHHGTATIEDFREAIDEWHKSGSKEPVNDYLGISKEEYFQIIRHPESIKKLQRKYPAAGSFAGAAKKKYEIKEG